MRYVSFFRKKFFHPNIYGAFLIVLGGVLAAASNGVVHGLSVSLPIFQMVFFKTATSLCLLIFIFRGRLKSVMQTKIVKQHAMKGLFGAFGNFFWFGALLYLPLAQSAALSLTSALFTSLGGWLLFKETFRVPVWLGLLIGFVGVFCILNPFTHSFQWAVILPLCSALFFSGSSLIIKSIARSDSSETTLFYLMFFMCLFSFFPAVLDWQMPAWQDLALLIAVGILYTLTQLSLIEAYTYGEASFIAPFKFARFPLNILTGFIFFAELPKLHTLLGGALILVANLTLVFYERRRRLKAS